MFYFSESYFQEEVRDGFTISATMKRSWAAQLELLNELDYVAHRHNIQYYAFWGTLLGAVRHGGFVPWDDDVDIAMRREDYTRFLEIVADEFPQGWVQNIYTEAQCRNMHTRLMNSTVIDLSEGHLSRYHGCPFIVGVDIFPIDALPADEQELENERTLLSLIGNLLSLIDAQGDERMVLEEGLVVLEEWFDMKFDRTEEVLLNQLHRLYDRVSAKDTNTGDMLNIVTKQLCLRKEWFQGIEYRQFECMSLPVPIGYDQILQTLYGDWRTPVRGGGLHDYPVYKNQLEALWERGLYLNMGL